MVTKIEINGKKHVAVIFDECTEFSTVASYAKDLAESLVFIASGCEVPEKFIPPLCDLLSELVPSYDQCELLGGLYGDKYKGFIQTIKAEVTL